MEWMGLLRWVVGIGMFLVPVVMLVLVGAYVVLMPVGVVAGMLLKGSEPQPNVARRSTTVRHAH